jgi:hypothetical protein
MQMRTPPRNAALVAAIAGIGALFAGAPVSAQNIPLSSCSSWSINSGVFSCTPIGTGGGGAVAPSGCAVAVNPSSGPAGTSVVVSAACSGGDPVATYTWTGGFMANKGNVASGGGSVNVTTQFALSASNAGGTATATPATFTVTSTGGGGGGNTGGGISCSPFGTLVIPMVAVPGSTSLRYSTNNYGGFGNGTVVVAKFTTSAAATGTGSFRVGEFAGGPLPRTSSISTTPCDFNTAANGGTAIGLNQSSSWFQNFIIGTRRLGFITLHPSTTYYINVKNQLQGVDTCPGGACDIGIEVSEP